MNAVDEVVRMTVERPMRPEDGAAQQEAAVLEMVRRRMRAARDIKMTGELIFKLSMRDGGVASKKSVIEVSEK